MRIDFTQDDFDQERNKIYLEEDDVTLTGEYLEVNDEGDEFVITGSAVVEGETYHDFKVAFGLLHKPDEMTAEAIMGEDWDWYDFVY
ncbi:MAG: hypothetical protein KHZ62_08205 [Clostridiales bacterium]|nr:hypothetical protein [Clostridiales bacterium]